jgi:DNA-binding transcriptional regulator PaaX
VNSLKKRYLPFHEFLQPNLAYTANDIAKMLNIDPITARKYCRRGVVMGLLEMRKKGRFKVYALTEKAVQLQRETGIREPRICEFEAWPKETTVVVSSETENKGGVRGEYAN